MDTISVEENKSSEHLRREMSLSERVRMGVIIGLGGAILYPQLGIGTPRYKAMICGALRSAYRGNTKYFWRALYPDSSKYL